MSAREFKYTGQQWQTRAILALIGQVHLALDSRVLVSDVAVWMNRSKPTARKLMNELVECGHLSRIKFKNRHEYQLTDATYANYLNGMFKADLKAYYRNGITRELYGDE